MTGQTSEQPWTVLRLIEWTKDHFTARQVQQPRLSAEVLLAHVLKCRRMDLYTRFGAVPAGEQLAGYRELVRLAAQHEPVAYLVGHREFYSLDFVVTSDVLIPRPETELLVDKAIECLNGLGRHGRYWDACTGCGAVAIATGVRKTDAAVLATDISESALAVARRNIAAHGLGDRITVAAANLLELPADLAELALFDVITANPPYVSASQMDELSPDVRREPRTALFAGEDGLDCIRPIVTQAPDVLGRGGMLAVEIGYGQAEAVWDLVNRVDRYDRVGFARDVAGIERVLVAHKKI
ncbi:MAG: peptide chain release factor N(5)-glutamine methyltransferase [Planctomycetes bacterium]|nr:peptide chain release factor N(5)-glutamine methyltransferase [Planctomycetota bacterium]